MNRFLSLMVGLALAGCADGAPAPSAPDVTLDGNLIRAHMVRLSSDEFLGRGPGQPGGDMAAEFLAGRFADYGLEPVNGSYFQSVPMVGYTTNPSSASLSFRSDDGVLTAPYLDGFVLNAGDPEATEVSGTAEVVFVGYGVDAPENDWNDFAGVDVRGKFILILVNDPPATADEPDLFGGPAMTYYGRWTYKWEEAARQGALGALIVHETEPAGYPWSVVRGGRSGEQFSLPPDPSAPQPAGMVGWVTRDVAAGILALGGLDYEAMKAAAGTRGFVAVPTGVTASAGMQATVRSVETKNVVGLLKGSRRPDDIITITSHYDHFGVGEAVAGDSIYNGAYDNASGTALLMELARTFAALPERPGRSILFVSTAAEEQGLLGSQWYVQSPPFPLNHTVAEINIDGANLWGEADDVVVHGEERSGLGAYVRPRAAELGLEIIPDAEPEKGFFFRSDHFPFAKAGVPSLYIEHGRKYRNRPEGWGQAIQDEYTALRYHAPSDEFSPDFVFDGAVQQGLLVFRTAWDIAQDTTWPTWNDGQEFKAARDAMMTGR
ncbi:MAG TPA: M28 family peptidase [Longimicrobiales bacterium]|nr:M28 family peptidase [Longimicrobiales bacterium]